MTPWPCCRGLECLVGGRCEGPESLTGSLAWASHHECDGRTLKPSRGLGRLGQAGVCLPVPWIHCPQTSLPTVSFPTPLCWLSPASAPHPRGPTRRVPPLPGAGDAQVVDTWPRGPAFPLSPGLSSHLSSPPQLTKVSSSNRPMSCLASQMLGVTNACPWHLHSRP